MQVAKSSNGQTQRAVSQQAGWTFIAALFISLYFPTSIGGVINPHLTMIGNLLALFTLLYGAALFGIKFSGHIFAAAAILLLMLCVFSFLSPYTDITLGSVVPYLTLCIICSLKHQQLYFSRAQLKCLAVIVVSMLLFSLLVVADVKPVIEFQKSFYQVFPDLFDFMVTWANKPVIMFATHSVAGFAFFIIAIVSFLFSNVVSTTKLKFSLRTMSILCSVLLVLLISNTGFFLFFAMLVVYLVYFLRHSHFAVLLVICSVMLFLILDNLMFLLELSAEFSKLFFEVILKENNGLLARMSMNSRLAGSYEYVFNSPLIGVGFTYGGDLAFGDNILSEYILRAGFAGYFLVMLMVVGYLYANLTSKLAFFLLLAFVLMSDLGYPLFVAFRFVFIFPVLIILVNMYTDMYRMKKRSSSMRFAVATPGAA